MGAVPVARESSVPWRMAADTATVGFWTTAAKIVGALKVIAMARFFGASGRLDAFLIAFLIPAFIAETVAGSFTVSLVPVLIRTRSVQGEEGARALSKKALGMSFAIAVVVVAIAAVCGPWLLPLFGSSLPGEDLAVARRIYWILLLWLPMSACICTWRAILNANAVFAVPAAAQVGTPLITILVLLVASRQAGVYALCAGTLAGVAVEFAVLASAVRRRTYPVLPARFEWDAEVAGIWKQYLPLTAGAMIFAACALVNQGVAGMLGSGSVSALSYGTRLTTVLAGIAATAVSTAALPELSRLVAQADWARLRRTLWIACGVACVVSLPVVYALVSYSEPLLRVVLERGAFTRTMTVDAAAIQRFAVLQLPFAIALAIFVKLASALAANDLITRVAAVTLVANVILDFVFAKQMGTAGIALATSVVQGVALIALIFLLRAREPRIVA